MFVFDSDILDRSNWTRYQCFRRVILGVYFIKTNLSFDWSMPFCETNFDWISISSNRGISLPDYWNTSVMGYIFGFFWCNLNAYKLTWLDASYFLDLLTLNFLVWKYTWFYISIYIDLSNGETKGSCYNSKHLHPWCWLVHVEI